MALPKLKAGNDPLSFDDHDRNMKFLLGFVSLAAMLADTERGYSFYEPGQGILVLAEGYRYRVAASDASNHHLITGAGLKLYVAPVDEGAYNFGAFNPTLGGVVDNYAKLRMALDVVAVGEAPNKIGPTLIFPKGLYRFNSTAELNTRVTLLGSGATPSGTAFVFAGVSSGFVVNSFNTGAGTAISEEDATTAGLSGAAGSVFKKIMFYYGAAGAKPSARADIDAIWMRAKASVIDCAFWGWPRSGVRVEAWAPADKPSNPELWGDARGWFLEDNIGSWCGKSPLRVRGTRASGGVCALSNFAENGWWAIDDHALGSNFYIGNHSATDGVGTAGANTSTLRKSGVVSYGGNLYKAAVVLGDDGDPTPEHLEALVTTIPGEDNEVWRYWKVGGPTNERPLWTASPTTSAEQYFPTGGFKFSNPASGHVGLGNYSEDNVIGQYYVGENVFVAGGIQTNMHFGSKYMLGDNGQIKPLGGFRVNPDELTVTLAENASDRGGITVYKAEDSIWNLFTPDASGDLQFKREGFPAALSLTGATPAHDFGTTGAPATIKHVVHVPQLVLGDITVDGARCQDTLPAAPTDGDWAIGDIVWNRDPTAGGNASWTYTADGWKASNSIAE